MKNTKYLIMMFLLLISVGGMIASCASSGEPKDKITADRIIGTLEANGADIINSGVLKESLLSVAPDTFFVSGDTLQIYEYKTESDALADSKKISKEGSSVGNSMVTWIAPPHFFMRQNYIVLYLGSNEKFLSALESIFGAQFAGADKITVTNFEECAAAGNPVMESYPRQCRTIDGQTFVEETDDGKMSGDYTKDIETPKGSLFLTYSGGKATLTGTLQRSTPCTEFDVQVMSTRDFPTSNVNINIYDKNKGVMCIQMLGEPQEITIEIPSVSENTHYTVTYEETEKLFEGKLGGN